MSIVFAVAAMLFKIVGDLLSSYTIRRNNGKKVNSYHNILTITMISSLAILGFTGTIELHFDVVNVLSGALIGIFSFVSYLFYLKALNGDNPVIYITIYRLNFIVASILGIIFLNEALTVAKTFAGILFILAILMFVEVRDVKSTKFGKRMIYIIISCLLLGFIGLAIKLSFSAGANRDSMLFYRYLTSVFFTLGYSAIDVKRGKHEKIVKDRNFIFLSVAGGLILLISMFLYYHALNLGELSVVTPITQSCFVFSSVISFTFLKERVTKKKIAGLVFAVLCIVSISI